MASSELICTFASLPRTTRGQSIVLGGDPKGENFLYCNGNNVYIKDINDPAKCDVYSEHAAPTTLAKYSPSRFYIASGDSSGKVRIWDTVNKEHILKNEYHVLGAAVKDVAWAPDSTKLAVVGDGREFYAKCITADSGNTVGDLSGHNKSVNSVAYRPTRPFRLVTASEDMRTQFYEGPPFKYKEQHMEHTNFVNCVRYHPQGDVYITGGADGKALIYDGKTSEYLDSLGGEKAHQGGIYSLDFSPDGSEVLTVSGDKTAKIWNLQSKQQVVEFTLGKDINDMQVGCLWQGKNIISVSLSGYINFLDRENPSSPKRIQKGHNKAITAMTLNEERTRCYTGASDGQIYGWDVKTGICEIINGNGHTNQVSDMTVAGDLLISIGMDDTVRFTSMSQNEYDSNACKLPSQPNAVAALPSGVAVITCINHLAVVDRGNLMFQQEVKFGPCCVDIHPGGTTVAFGAKGDVHIFELGGTSLKGVKRIEMPDDVTGVKFSPDGAYLVATTGSRRFTRLMNVANDYEEVYKTTKQTGRLFTVAWSPDSQHFATGSLDGSIVVWCLDPKFDKSVKLVIKDAHKKAYVQSLAWLSENVLVSASNDSCVKQWKVKL